MRSSPKLASAALALSIVFLSFVSSAFVEPKEEVAAVTLAWGQALGEDDLRCSVRQLCCSNST